MIGGNTIYSFKYFIIINHVRYKFNFQYNTDPYHTFLKLADCHQQNVIHHITIEKKILNQEKTAGLDWT